MRRVVLLGHDQFLIGRVRAAAIELAGVTVLPTAPSKFAPELAVLRPTLVLVELGGSDTLANLPHIIASIVTVAGEVPVVVIGDANNAADVLAAVRAGSTDFLDREECVPNLRAHLERRLSALGEVRSGERQNFSVVLNAQAGGGGGLFALNLAVLRASRAEEALFIDCQLPASEAGAALDIGASYSLTDAVRDISRMDRTLLLSAIARHEASGLSVLPLALRAADQVAISHEGLLAALRTIRPLFKDVVLNAGGIREPGLLDVLSDWATSIHLVCPQTVTALRDAKDLLAVLPAQGDVAGRVVLVVDQCSPRIDLSPEQMRAALRLDRVIALPDVRDDLLNGLNVGRPYVLARPRAPYALAIGAAAQGLDPAPPARPRAILPPIGLRRRRA
ncbi:hypothetical protein [Sphingomonas sp.]|uniref:AAA family ATPase n=1 Tax=Sphingomonas sp. TaxID=28214 RepID=UPI002CE8AC8D|nr:hypothetical protein [Sphingomonas sp.]HWK36510.1 hypothetical protein [Sphingomonas sp.]